MRKKLTKIPDPTCVEHVERNCSIAAVEASDALITDDDGTEYVLQVADLVVVCKELCRVLGIDLAALVTTADAARRKRLAPVRAANDEAIRAWRAANGEGNARD
jgi:hypothetical protein